MFAWELLTILLLFSNFFLCCSSNNMQNSTSDSLFVGTVLIQVFAGNLGLYGLIAALILSQMEVSEEPSERRQHGASANLRNIERGITERSFLTQFSPRRRSTTARLSNPIT